MNDMGFFYDWYMYYNTIISIEYDFGNKYPTYPHQGVTNMGNVFSEYFD